MLFTQPLLLGTTGIGCEHYPVMAGYLYHTGMCYMSIPVGHQNFVSGCAYQVKLPKVDDIRIAEAVQQG